MKKYSFVVVNKLYIDNVNYFPLFIFIFLAHAGDCCSDSEQIWIWLKLVEQLLDSDCQIVGVTFLNKFPQRAIGTWYKVIYVSGMGCDTGLYTNTVW